MKNTNIVMLTVLIAQSVCGSNEQKKIVTYFNNYRSWISVDNECVEIREKLELEKNGDVTIHVEKISDSKPSCILTVGPSNKIDLELRIKAHTPQAREIVSNVVAHQVEIMRCLRTQPTTTEEVDACIDLYCKVWLKTRSSLIPAGAISPARYKDSVNRRWNDFAELINHCDVSVQKESDRIALCKMSGEINTKTVEALACSPCALFHGVAMQKRGKLAESAELLKQHAYIDLLGIMYAACAKKDCDSSHVSVRVTKLDVTNMQPTKTFTYENLK